MSYLVLYGDPILGQNGIPTRAEFRIEDVIPQEQLADMKLRFKMLPRQVFDASMVSALNGVEGTDYSASTSDKTIQAQLQSTEKYWTYAHLLDLFNTVNEAEMIARNISDPWDWEAQKMQVLYETEAQGSLAASNPELFLQNGDGDDYTKLMVRDGLEKRAVSISQKFPDQALKLQFLASVNFLLDQELFTEVDMILQTYESLSSNAWAGVQNLFGGSNVAING